MRRPIAMMFVAVVVPIALAAPSLISATSKEAASQAPKDECSLLSVAEIRELTEREDYPDDTDGDPPGEGLGGGSSCNYGGRTWGNDYPPRVSVILIPPNDGERWTDRRRTVQLYEGCERETVPVIGEDAFFEDCPQTGELPLYVKARNYDLVVAMEVMPTTTPETLKAKILAVAKAAVSSLN